MPNVIHLISDLHLCEEQPHVTALFEKYMQEFAPQSQQLFVLGDLFEVWVGDDNKSPFNQNIIKYFKRYTQNHGKLFFIHGNRDFLLGDSFAQQCGAQLINEPYHLQWNNTHIELMHGDILCTDDVEYQEFRSKVRQAQWQNEFLSLNIEQRLNIVSGLREQSISAQQTKENDIMDVNASSVKGFFQTSQCDWLIHGHTHRQATHKIELANNKTGVRIVLSDWHNKGHYLELSNGQYNDHFFSA